MDEHNAIITEGGGVRLRTKIKKKFRSAGALSKSKGKNRGRLSAQAFLMCHDLTCYEKRNSSCHHY